MFDVKQSSLSIVSKQILCQIECGGHLIGHQRQYSVAVRLGRPENMTAVFYDVLKYIVNIYKNNDCLSLLGGILCQAELFLTLYFM